jgi:diguanylate cyclase (GGDEF)-like protein/PAS domain S-box-containing protein
MHGSLPLPPNELADLGYKELSHISETDLFCIYRARAHGNQTVLIKVPVTTTPSPRLVRQLEHELEISSDLNSEYVVRADKIERGTTLNALILQDCPYPPLYTWLNSPLQIPAFLPLAIGITSALAQIHHQGIVHRDITPANIFATADGKVKLSGFGIASRLLSERRSPAHPREIANTLAYMAPEQTGRMNRSIDTRSDLYALGVVFYRMLTGRLPFNATDPMAWVHCHIAIQPKPPRELLSTIPVAFSEIVMKLLAKDAQKRYQTAEGLKIDLRHCLDEWREKRSIEPFELGRQDISSRLAIPEKLYGRAGEVDQLLSTIDRVVNSGKAEVLLVSGYAGVGKSALIHEMHRSLVSPNALFAEGKFNQHRYDTPYAILAHALQALVRQVLDKGEAAVAQWRQNLKQAVEPNGRLVTDLVPDLISLIGEQPAVAEVPPQDALNRFNNVVRRLVEVFAQPEHPLVLFLDDLQWFDTASLQLLEYLLTYPGIKHLLLLGAYRDNEVGRFHPLRQTIEVMGQSAHLSEIVLKPLTIEDLCQLIADSLRTNTEHVLSLALLVQEKTGGNPFFVRQFLSLLADEDLLAFDIGTSTWHWDLVRIHAKGYSDNVIDLMLEKLGRLPNETQEALKQLACLDTVVAISTLLRLYEQSEERLHLALWEAVRAGLIVRQQDDAYRFVHDRVREAAYALIPEEKRPQVHLNIGRKLLEEQDSESVDEILFDAVTHLNQGAQLIKNPAEITQLADLNAAAGRKACAATAYSTARAFFAAAATILPEAAWQDHYDFQFALYLDWAEAEYLHGDYEQAEHLFSILKIQAQNDLDRVRLHMLRLSLYPISGKYDDALAAGIEALGLLGESVPEHDEAIGQAMEEEAVALKIRLRNQPIAKIPQAPEATDPQAKIMIELLTNIGGPAYIGSRPELYPLFAYMNLNQVLQYGVTKEACHTFSAYAILQASSLGDLAIAHESSEAAIRLSERFGEPGTMGSVLYLHGNHVNFWLKPFASDFSILERGFRACTDGGNLAFANYIGYSIIWQALERGDALEEVLDFSRKYADFALESGNQVIYHTIVLEQQFVKCLMGKTEGAISFSSEEIDELKSVEAIDSSAFTCGLTYYHTMKMMAAYLMGDDAAARLHADEAWRVHSAVLSQPMQAMFYFLHALILTQFAKDTANEKRRKILETLADYRRKLAFWAKHCPTNFAAKHALVAAQIAVVENDKNSARHFFEQAIEMAKKNGFIHWQAMANEAAGQFYAQHGQEAAAKAYLREAHCGYEQWGATAKAHQLVHRYHWLEQGLVLEPITLANRLDALSLIKASQKLSANIELPKLIHALITITLESAGANRGVLFLARHNRFEANIEATATHSGGVLVKQAHTPIDPTSYSKAIVNRVINTHKSILIDDVAHPGDFLKDPYLLKGAVKSILCLPLLRLDNMNGVLYLENRQTTGAFTHDRAAVLDVLASQAAISLENTYLINNLRENEYKFRNLLQKIQAAVVVHGADTQILTANSMAQDLLGLSEAQLLGKTAIDPAWHFLREDGSVMPQEEYPVNQVLSSFSTLLNRVVGVDRPDREGPVWALVNAIPVFDEAGSISEVIVSFSDITERKKAEQQLTASEQLFRTLVENSPDHIARYDRELRCVYLNPAMAKQFKAPLDIIIGKTSKEYSPWLDPERYMANLRKVIETGQEVSDEVAYQTPTGENHWVSSRFAPEFDLDGKAQSVLVISNDTTKQKLAESERLEYLRLLESLDRINRIFQTGDDIEKIMHQVLDEVLNIFDCDRAYMIYPCDPNVPFWSVKMERTVPDYPGASLQGPQPMDQAMSCTMQALLETGHPLQFGPGGQHPVTPLAREKFNTQSVMAMVLQPKTDKPWQFGIQQCSHKRIWSAQEMRLFEEIGHRLSDGLNNLFITRDLRESEERFRLVFESSPVSIQEEDYSAVKAYLKALSPEYGDDLAGYLNDHPEVVERCASLVRMIDVNHASLMFHEAESKQALLRGLAQIFIPETMEAYREVLVSLMRGKTQFRLESEIQTLTGKHHNIDTFISVCSGYEESLGKVLISLIDITELKQAEHERQQHLYFLESLDRINKVLQTEGDMQEVLKRILDEMLDIFDCSRAYLLYPSDPDSPTWSVPIERTVPEYPSVFELGVQIPMNDMMAWQMRLVLNADQPVRGGPGNEYPVTDFLHNEFGVRAFIAMSLYPKVDKPWQFGIQQCSYNRIWSDQEARLLEEIGHRLSDGLNNLVITRNLRESEERFRLVYENSPISIWEEDFSAVKFRLDELKAQYGDDLESHLVTHPDIVQELAATVRIVNVNRATLELHEADSKEALYKCLPQTFLPESYDAFRKELLALSQGKTELLFDSTVRTLRGERRDVTVSFSVCPGYEHNLSKVFVSLFDITQRKQDEDNLRLGASVFATSQEGILISDANNRIIDVNPAFTRLTGYSREEALGKNPSFLGAGEMDSHFYKAMWQRLSDNGEWRGEIWNRRKSGEVYPEQLSIVAVRDNLNRLQHYVGAFSDISMIKQHEADLNRIAHYDMLTSVPNRRLLGDRLEQAIAYSRRHSKNLAVCYLDLDGFKPINDQFGHEGGDRMLVEIARRLQAMSRGEDTLARLGGDEFVLLWNDIDSEAECMKALERILERVSEPMMLGDEQVSVSASIGVTLYPNDNVDADNLLRHADHAMYTAKQLGKNRYQIFDAHLERQITARTELLIMVERGLEKGELELYYQPKMDFTTGKVIGLEALLRWNDPSLGLVLPNEFLSFVENDALAIRVGRLVMEDAICQAKRWDEKGIHLPISINIFPRHLKSQSFINDLRSAIEMNWPEMPSRRLLMEIIETSDLEELEPIEEVINECLEIGVGFSLDDFGTGYSSLVYLRRLSIEELKIDKSFVRDMLEDPDDEAIVVGVIRLGQAFGLRVVAEGVEYPQQARYLVDLGCTIIQGYGLGRPMPVCAFEKWYANYINNEIPLYQN